jgi:hypothetical protein
MKMYPNILKPVKQYGLIGIIVLINLFGLSLKANAQNTLLADNVDKINNGITVQMVDYDYDIIIPKVTTEELNSIEDAVFNQLVYVVDGAKGYYFYKEAEWGAQSIREVFELIDKNLQLQKPSVESLILMAGEEDSKVLLDYNHHVKGTKQEFGFNKKDNAMTIYSESK